MKYLITLLTFFSLTLVQAQDQYFDIKNPDYDLLGELYMEKLNAHRNHVGAKTLENDNDLYKPALDQAEYQKKTGRLSHTQNTAGRRTLGDRMRYYGIKFREAGENLLYTSLHKVKGKPMTYGYLAQRIFDLWKDSPGHYENMIRPSYNLSGLAFVVDIKTNRLYVAQVFTMDKYQKVASE